MVFYRNARNCGHYKSDLHGRQEFGVTSLADRATLMATKCGIGFGWGTPSSSRTATLGRRVD